MNILSFDIENFGEKNFQNIIYVGSKSSESMSAGQFYNKLIQLSFPFCIRAKLGVQIPEIDVCGIHMKWRHCSESWTNSHRVIFYKLGQERLFLNQFTYNPFEWDETKCARLVDIFSYYFTLSNSVKWSETYALGIYLDSYLILDDEAIQEYFNNLMRVIKERKIENIYLYDPQAILADKVKDMKHIEVVDISKYGKEQLINKLCRCRFLGGTSCPYVYFLCAVKRLLFGEFEEVHMIQCAKTQVDNIFMLQEEMKENVFYHKIRHYRKNGDRSACFCKFMDYLADLYGNNVSLTDRLCEADIHEIGLYGWGTVGKLLFHDLANKNKVKIRYIVDKYRNDTDINIIKPDEILEKPYVDAIIVTPLFHFEEVYIELRDSGVTVPIVPIEYFVYRLPRNANGEVARPVQEGR